MTIKWLKCSILKRTLDHFERKNSRVPFLNILKEGHFGHFILNLGEVGRRQVNLAKKEYLKEFAKL